MEDYEDAVPVVWLHSQYHLHLGRVSGQYNSTVARAVLKFVKFWPPKAVLSDVLPRELYVAFALLLGCCRDMLTIFFACSRLYTTSVLPMSEDSSALTSGEDMA